MRRIYLLCWLFILPAFSWAQDASTIKKIRTEGLENSQVMNIAFHLTEMSGPRVTASPGYFRAARYAIDQLKEWGVVNVQLDPWGDFGKGWELKKSYVAMSYPWYKPLIAFPKVWTGGTNGYKKAPVLLIDAEDSASLVAKYKGKLNGKVLIMNQLIDYKLDTRADLVRWTDAQLDSMAKIKLTPTVQQRSRDTAGFAQRRQQMFQEFAQRRQKAQALNNLAKSEGALAIFTSSPKNHDGTVFVQGGGSYAPNAPANFLDIAVSLEDYNMMIRLLQHGSPVEVDLDVATEFQTNTHKGYNVIGEIKGTDPKIGDEVVMLGGHLDSWQGATGATDNAAGSAVMMEAMRILKTLNVQPKRTIRIALWNGEEQGIFGSRNYVAKTFADRSDMKLKPEHEKFDVYFNLDNGTGRIRGIYLQQNEAAGKLLGQWMKPFADLGATTLTVSNTGGTDHLSFDAVGLPGFQFIQDEVEYDSRTHHSNMDSYDHLSADDLKQAATIVAGMVYQAAMSNQKVPRKELPKPQTGRGFF